MDKSIEIKMISSPTHTLNQQQETSPTKNIVQSESVIIQIIFVGNLESGTLT